MILNFQLAKFDFLKFVLVFRNKKCTDLSLIISFEGIVKLDFKYPYLFLLGPTGALTKPGGQVTCGHL